MDELFRLSMSISKCIGHAERDLIDTVVNQLCDEILDLFLACVQLDVGDLTPAASELESACFLL